MKITVLTRLGSPFTLDLPAGSKAKDLAKAAAEYRGMPDLAKWSIKFQGADIAQDAALQDGGIYSMSDAMKAAGI